VRKLAYRRFSNTCCEPLALYKARVVAKGYQEVYNLGSCRGDVDITEALNKTMVNQWVDFSVDLNCFAERGVQFDKIVVPVELRSKGVISLSVSNIHFEANAAKSANVRCD